MTLSHVIQTEVKRLVENDKEEKIFIRFVNPIQKEDVEIIDHKILRDYWLQGLTTLFFNWARKLLPFMGKKQSVKLHKKEKWTVIETTKLLIILKVKQEECTHHRIIDQLKGFLLNYDLNRSMFYTYVSIVSTYVSIVSTYVSLVLAYVLFGFTFWNILLFNEIKDDNAIDKGRSSNQGVFKVEIENDSIGDLEEVYFLGIIHSGEKLDKKMLQTRANLSRYTKEKLLFASILCSNLEILGKGFITKNMAKSEGLLSVHQLE